MGLLNGRGKTATCGIKISQQVDIFELNIYNHPIVGGMGTFTPTFTELMIYW